METKNYDNLAQQILEMRNHFSVVRKQYTFDDELQVFKAIGNQLTNGKYEIDKENEFVIINTLNWLLGKDFECINPETNEKMPGDHQKGLYIAGTQGTGKSMILVILAAIAAACKINYDYGNQIIQFAWCEQRADEICNRFVLNGPEILKKCIDTPVLCLNDFGIGNPEQIYMGNRMNIIRQIIESRADTEGKFTVMTSNYPMNYKTIFEQYGDRVVSRLFGMCNYFVLTGNDRRKSHV